MNADDMKRDLQTVRERLSVYWISLYIVTFWICDGLAHKFGSGIGLPIWARSPVGFAVSLVVTYCVWLPRERRTAAGFRGTVIAIALIVVGNYLLFRFGILL